MHHLKHRPRSSFLQSDWEALASKLMSEGRFFAAFDEASFGLQVFPDSRVLKQLKARALMRTGGLEEAKEILEGLLPQLSHKQSLSGWLQTIPSRLNSQTPPSQASQQLLTVLQELLHEVQCRWLHLQAPDEESIGLLARIYKDLWRRQGDLHLARHSRDLYNLGYCHTGGYWTGINAATMSLVIGEADLARETAARVIAQCRLMLPAACGTEAYWLHATLGEALLLSGQTQAAIAAYETAADLVEGNFDLIVSSRQQLRLLQQHGVAVPEEIWQALQPPTVVVFTGHMLDQPGRNPPRFPESLAEAVGQAIEQELRALNARIGFSGAACGADLLFLEAMQEQQARTEIVLPFSQAEYEEISVGFAGRAWRRRFHRALAAADSLRLVTTETYLGDDVLFRFANQITVGLAYLSAHCLDTRPHLLAVWDGIPVDLPGGTADLISRWPDPQRCAVIRLDHLRDRFTVSLTSETRTPPDPPQTAGVAAPGGNRQRLIKTLLFADLHQFAALAEEQLPFYIYEFLAGLAEKAPPPPGFINTWGDAIFLALDEALPLVDYAFALREAVMETDWSMAGLPRQLSIRIALHAGPVFQAPDALTGRDTLYGSHVNRAARMEPTTPPGKIYASEQFAALLLSEQEAAGKPEAQRYICDYAGIISLAKDFGRQPVFHLRRRTTHEAKYL